MSWKGEIKYNQSKTCNMPNNYEILISYKRKNRQATNCWPCHNVMFHVCSFGFPIKH